MHYLVWAFLAMLAYSFVAPFVRRATAGGLPPFAVLLVTSAALFVATIGVALATGQFQAHYFAPARAQDAMELFGFASGAERDVFETLRSVSGIGPKLALAALSALSALQSMGLSKAEAERALRKALRANAGAQDAGELARRALSEQE